MKWLDRIFKRQERNPLVDLVGALEKLSRPDENAFLTISLAAVKDGVKMSGVFNGTAAPRERVEELHKLTGVVLEKINEVLNERGAKLHNLEIKGDVPAGMRESLNKIEWPDEVL